MTGVDVVAGEWLLFAAFRGKVTGLVARGASPADIQGDPATGVQLLKNLKVPKEYKNLITRVVDGCARVGEVVQDTSTVHDKKIHGYGEPVISGRDQVHGVWLWLGLVPTPTHPHVLTGAWEWQLPSYTTVYGPGIPEIYKRPDWVVGQEYPVNETVNAQTDAPAQEGADTSANAPDGFQMPMRIEIDRAADGHSPEGPRQLATIRAVAEVVDSGRERRWLGLTWEVTAYDPPNESPARAMLRQFARAASGWTGAVWWDDANHPGQIIVGQWTGGQRPDIVAVTPGSSRVVVHDRDRGRARHILDLADRYGSASSTLTLRGTDDQWHSFEVAVEKIRTSYGPLAGVLKMNEIPCVKGVAS